MSVTIVSTNQEVDFLKNPIALKVHGTNYVASEGTKFWRQIEKVGTLTVGDTILFEFFDYQISFDVVATIDDSGKQLTAAATIDQTIEELNFNYYLFKYYDIEKVSLVYIKCTARENGSALSLSISLNTAAYSLHSSGGGNDINLAENYKIIAIPYLKPNYFQINYDRFNEILLDVDTAGNAVLYLSGILESLFKNIIELPEFNTNYLKKAYNVIKEYYVDFAEYYGSPPEVQGLYSFDEKRVINGALPVDKFQGHTWFANLSSNKKFLTNQPTTRETWKGAQQFLYYLNFRDIQDDDVLTGVLVYRTSDPGNPLLIFKAPLSNVDQMDVLAVPCGYNQLNLASYGDIYQYKLCLYGDDPIEIISESITFNVVPKSYHAIQFLCKNDFGVWETLQCEAIEKSYKTKSKLQKKNLSYDYDLTEVELASNILESYNILKVKSQYLRKQDAEHLKEMLGNNDIYLIAETQYIPCEIKPASFKLVSEDKDLYLLKFEVRYRFDGNLSTDEL